MSRETRMALITRHRCRSVPRAKRGAKLTPSPIPGYRNGSADAVAKPFDGAILLESVRVALQS